MVENNEDAAIIRRVTSGEADAFGKLYTKYHGRLLGYCYRLLQDAEAARDVVQTAFTKAMESLSSLERPESFYSWIFTIARNESYTILRTRRGTEAGLSDEVWDTDTPHDQMVQKETSEQVGEALNRLKPEYREVLVLRHFERLSYGEIAAITGDTVSSVESRLFKARKALLKHLNHALEERTSS
jgi:RNA polymerase sigma-70 factor (ECF subfamily)